MLTFVACLFLESGQAIEKFWTICSIAQYYLSVDFTRIIDRCTLVKR